MSWISEQYPYFYTYSEDPAHPVNLIILPCCSACIRYKPKNLSIKTLAFSSFVQNTVLLPHQRGLMLIPFLSLFSYSYNRIGGCSSSWRAFYRGCEDLGREVWPSDLWALIRLWSPAQHSILRGKLDCKLHVNGKLIFDPASEQLVYEMCWRWPEFDSLNTVRWFLSLLSWAL